MITQKQKNYKELAMDLWLLQFEMSHGCGSSDCEFKPGLTVGRECTCDPKLWNDRVHEIAKRFEELNHETN